MGNIAKKYLILVTGLPASGKTTIATHLAKDLGLQYVGKDQYKIEMYEKYGFSSVEEKKNLNKKTEEIMYSRLYSLLQNGYNVVFDKWICKDYSRIDVIAKELGVEVVVIYLNCKVDIAVSRYNNRIDSGERHIGLSLKNIYPYVKGYSEVAYMTLEEMQQRYELYKEKTFGDYILEVSTDNIDESIYNYQKIKDFIFKIIN